MNTQEIHIESQTLPLLIRKRKGTRRMVLRYNALHHRAQLTLPWQVSLKDGIAFAQSRREWLAQQMRRERVALVPGAIIPIFGEAVTLRCRAEQSGVVVREGAVLYVKGRPEHFARRVKDWLKAEALSEIRSRVHACAARIGRPVGKITVRDMRTQWGSCTRAGNLCFSWRLIFAPPEVMDYLVAHETAHLQHMNHSATFWRLVEHLHPNYHPAQHWLKHNGEALYRMG